MRSLSAGEVAFAQRRHVAFLVLQVVRAVVLPVFPRLGSAQIKVTRHGVGMELRRADGGVIAVEVVGQPGATPVLFCHGLADSRLSAHSFAGAAHEFGLRLIAPDRPGMGRTNARRLNRVVDWVAEAILVLDALDVGSVALLGVSGGGAFAAAARLRCPIASEACCLSRHLAAYLPHPRDGGRAAHVLACGQTRPAFSGWFLGRLATVARREPGLFLRLATNEMPDIDRRTLARPDVREAFLTNYLRALHPPQLGSRARSAGADPALGFRDRVHHGTDVDRPRDADTTVPLQHARRFAEAIPGAQLQIHPGHGHFSILDAPVRTLATLAE